MNNQTIVLEVKQPKQKSKFQTKKEKRKEFYKENLSLSIDEFKTLTSLLGKTIISTFKLLYYSFITIGTLFMLLIMKPKTKNKTNDKGFEL